MALGPFDELDVLDFEVDDFDFEEVFFDFEVDDFDFEEVFFDFEVDDFDFEEVFFEFEADDFDFEEVFFEFEADDFDFEEVFFEFEDRCFSVEGFEDDVVAALVSEESFFLDGTRVVGFECSPDPVSGACMTVSSAEVWAYACCACKNKHNSVTTLQSSTHL